MTILGTPPVSFLMGSLSIRPLHMLVSDCHSVYQQPREHKIFDSFVARVMQKLCSGNGPFLHILFSFLRAIRRYLDRPERSKF